MAWDSDDGDDCRVGPGDKEHALLCLSAARLEDARDDLNGKVVAFCGGGRGQRRDQRVNHVSAPVAGLLQGAAI